MRLASSSRTTVRTQGWRGRRFMPRHRHAGVGAEPAAGGSPAGRGLGWLGTLGPTRRGSALAAASGPHHGLWPTLPLGRVGRDQGRRLGIRWREEAGKTRLLTMIGHGGPSSVQVELRAQAPPHLLLCMGKNEGCQALNKI